MIELFTQRPESSPTIYAYRILGADSRKDLLKVGFTNRDARQRIHEQLRTSGLKYEIVLEESAMRNDGSSFSDHDVHKQLKEDKIINTDGEWFKCTVDDVKSAIIAVRDGGMENRGRTLDFKMRPEQQAAVEQASHHFRDYKQKENKAPHFLWNAKMRFGKTFAAYQLALELDWKKVLVLTFKPAVQSAWEEDLKTHVDFEGWQFISRDGLVGDDVDESKPFVCFGSFQDYLGRNKATGGIKAKNEWAHLTDWDCVIFDEYHYGSWREKSKDLFESDGNETSMQMGDIKEFDEDILPITTKSYLYLSGTPFRAIESGEFIEEQIFNWTYTDEQKAKEEWLGESNPYASLPRMVMMTYQVPDDIKETALATEFNEFDLNVFFQAKGSYENAQFTFKDEVQKWLDLIRGSHTPTNVDNLKLGAKKPPMPFSDTRLLSVLTHTFWFMPSVASCYAMQNLLTERHNNFYHQYKVIVAAGNKAGLGVEALPPVYKAMKNQQIAVQKSIRD